MTNAEVLIVDYGMGNLYSVKRALEECKVQKVTISNQEKDFKTCSHIILPGVGSFRDAMENIKHLGLDNLIRTTVLEEKVPFLGICLGMQLMATEGTEHGISEGLNLIEGKVVLLKAENSDERIPHVGWNEIYLKNETNPLLKGIDNRSDFYFVHSYHFQAQKSENVIATTPYCQTFASIIAQDHILGVQFHPEKSGKKGFQLLQNFLNFS